MNTTNKSSNNSFINTNKNKSNNNSNSNARNSSLAPALPSRTLILSVIAIAVIAMIVLLAIYGGYRWWYNSEDKDNSSSSTREATSEITHEVINSRVQYNISSSSIPASPFNNEYTIAFWMKIADYNYRYGQSKVIMQRGNLLSIELAPDDTTLLIKMGTSAILRNSGETQEQFNNLRQYDNDPYNLDSGIFGTVSNNDATQFQYMIPIVDSSEASYRGTSICKRGQARLLESFISGTDTIVSVYANILLSHCNGDIISAAELDELHQYENDSAPVSEIIAVINDLLANQECSTPIPLNIATHRDLIQYIKTTTGGVFAPPYPPLTTGGAMTPPYPPLTTGGAMTPPSQNNVLSTESLLNNNMLLSGNNNNKSVAADVTTQMISSAVQNMQQSEELAHMNKRNAVAMATVCAIKNIPLQSWQHIAITVFNHILNVYQNGLLVSSCIIPESVVTSNGSSSHGMDGVKNAWDIVLFPHGAGYDGELTKFTISNVVLSQDKISSMYSDGYRNRSSLNMLTLWLVVAVIITSVIGAAVYMYM